MGSLTPLAILSLFDGMSWRLGSFTGIEGAESGLGDAIKVSSRGNQNMPCHHHSSTPGWKWAKILSPEKGPQWGSTISWHILEKRDMFLNPLHKPWVEGRGPCLGAATLLSARQQPGGLVLSREGVQILTQYLRDPRLGRENLTLIGGYGSKEKDFWTLGYDADQTGGA